MNKALVAEYADIPEMFASLVPDYKSVSYKPLVAKVRKFDRLLGRKVSTINPKRHRDRCENYLDPDEIKRVRARLAAEKTSSSLRFGVHKDGQGYFGDRSDFCVIGGNVEGKQLTLMYRSLELIGGFCYDLAMIDEFCDRLGWEPRGVTFIAASAHVFALKGNSNEMLYPKVKKIFGV
jgi:hypothetical protein